MSLTPEQIRLVQETWANVAPISETAAEIFYDRLFEIAPEVKPYFKSDMKEQGRKLMAMLNTAVNGLNDLESIIPAVEESGRRHASYGVKEKDYDSVASALLWTLEKGLGDTFSEEVKAAWTAVYGLLSMTMKNAASQVAV